MNIRFLVFTALLVSSFFYIGFRLADSPLHWIFLALMFGLLFSFPFIQWRHEAVAWPRAKVFVQRLIFVSLGFASWLLILTLLRDLTFLAVYLARDSERALHMLAMSRGNLIFGTAIFITLFGSWRAYYGVRIHEVKIVLDKLPAALVGTRIVQISDLHAGPTIGKNFVEKVVKTVNSLQPDLTVLTGDIGDGHVAEHKSTVAALADLLPAQKVFYVPGNHEYYWKADEWIAEFARLGAIPLLNRGQRLEHQGHTLWIGGITDPTADLVDPKLGPNVKAAMVGGEHADFKLLLSHRPGFAREASQVGFDLQLSGHTHGGQFFPWTYVAKFFHEHLLGLARYENMWLYISPGTGFWGPPMRIGTIPEITLLKLDNG